MGTDGLLPCPFCGGRAEIWKAQGEGRAAWIACMGDCGGPDRRGTVLTAEYATDDEAIAAWNRRAGGWVSVDERLPEEGVPVLVCAGDAMMVCDRFDPEDGGGWFWLLRTSPSGFASPGGVAHWQRIAPPAPSGTPQGDTDGD